MIDSLAEYLEQYKLSMLDTDKYWGSIAKNFVWRKEWHEILSKEAELYSSRWFQGSRLNITDNLLIRNIDRVNPAIIFEPNDPAKPSVSISYQELTLRVHRLALQLKRLGVSKGDRVLLYLPSIPEAVVSMLASAWLGAIHSVVFAGFSARSLADRIVDCQAKIIITATKGFRGTKIIATEQIVEEALSLIDEQGDNNTVESVIVYDNSANLVNPSPNSLTDHVVSRPRVEWDLTPLDYNLTTKDLTSTVEVEGTDPLFILYTSGSTGRPKGVVHATAGYMVYVASTFKNVFQVHSEDDNLFWCTADVGWITGHSYIVYGPLLNGASVLLFEGIPTYPDASRYWQIIEKHTVTHFYTAPTAIRALQSEGLDFVTPFSMSSLKVIGSVGEPINEDAWHWYHHHVGHGRCPLVDTWWQTETGGIMISPLAGITPTKPCFASLPLPGIEPVILDESGNELTGRSVEGALAIKKPWPAMLVTTFGNHERYIETYFSQYPGYYCTGDGVKRDEDGYYRILGRIDDVINVSGHRIGTAEVENAINEHPLVIESAVVGANHQIKGQSVVAFIVCDEQLNFNEEELLSEVKQLVVSSIGAFARPESIIKVAGLPKTRSGKIMRRILRSVSNGSKIDQLGDLSTLINPEVLSSLVK